MVLIDDHELKKTTSAIGGMPSVEKGKVFSFGSSVKEGPRRKCRGLSSDGPSSQKSKLGFHGKGVTCGGAIRDKEKKIRRMKALKKKERKCERKKSAKVL